ncbi:MAG: hypothetical protein HQRvContig02_27 [Haloquadratum phage sp.]|nr:MAG: hypothetical protein HQRvContig02_27 [Haloquadratum phage sp.]
MKPRLTSYYDPDDPPRATRMDEIDRLLGKTVGRAVVYLIYVFAVGGDVMAAFVSLIALGGWRLAVGAGLLVWTLAPLAYGVEHLWFDLLTSDN